MACGGWSAEGGGERGNREDAKDHNVSHVSWSKSQGSVIIEGIETVTQE